MLSWGELPHLIRSGSATVHLRRKRKGRIEVHVLATSGRRLAELGTAWTGTELRIPLHTAGTDGARMLYELVAAE